MRELPMPRSSTVLAVLALGLLSAGTSASAAAATPREFMVALTLDGRRIEGLPLSWDERSVHLLARDGRLWEFSPTAAQDFRQSAAEFQPLMPSELRAQLLRELDDGMEVTGTSHYMIAHAAQQRDQWAGRFEELYRSFLHYFSVRGFTLQEPRTPLLGVVCRDQAEFARYSARQGMRAPPGVLGWYGIESNRIILYNLGGKMDSPAWEETASVIIHEATHQMAFNTGIHSRYTPPPTWVAEGVATMFEAPGVYNSRFHPSRGERINRERLDDFRRVVRAHHSPDVLKSLVGSDQLFAARPAAAYAEAWALTFYLVESEPRKYADYLARTAAKPPFTEPGRAERLADFTAVYGDDWAMLEARFLRFLDALE